MVVVEGKFEGANFEIFALVLFWVSVKTHNMKFDFTQPSYYKNSFGNLIRVSDTISRYYLRSCKSLFIII